MRKTWWLLLLVSLKGFAASVNIIPEPASVKINTGWLKFENGVSVKAATSGKSEGEIAGFLKEELSGFKVPVLNADGKAIVLRLVPSQTELAGDESYVISITLDSIYVQSNTPRGLFYGCQSIAQLLRNAADGKQIQCMEISDSPQYAYRGMHLDVSRHFFSKQVVEHYLDLMALLKLNYFHWHLTDDQGWRIEIKKYPNLTETGAWRIENDGSKYGGYYTQEDIKEVVAYAQKRFITIVPEIDMPGHSSAVIAAYPWLGCHNDGTVKVANGWGVKKDICAPTDSVFKFYYDVLDELCSLFPGPYVHIGGDEVPKNQWKENGVAQELMKKKNLKNEEELQHYFMHQMETYLAAKGKNCIAWGEVVKGGLSDNMIVMSWLDKKAGMKAVALGNKVIMTPRFYCYFDYPQSVKDKKQAWWMVYLPLHKVYQFEPAAKSMSSSKRKLILGGQANVWTEYIPDEKRLEQQVMPRLAAMAEALWGRKKDFKDFKKRTDSSQCFTAKYP